MSYTRKEQQEKFYKIATGKNGKKYVLRETVESVYHYTDGNSKTGKAGNYNLPIEYTCNHDCECYKEGLCYACGGCYQFPDNQALYSENLNFFNMSTDNEFISVVSWSIAKDKLTLWRWFTIGDIPNTRFLACMVAIAKENPQVKFWSYTKKYSIVNAWIDKNGDLPKNLVIIFSHWLNRDGTYYSMENPHNLPTSEFIPIGKEELTKTVTHVCPCSDPTVKSTCATCDHPCYTLKSGESMALLEHSTKATKARDKAIKEAKAQLK